MNDAPFHLTRMGARFYEHTLPELVRQIARLNENLERLVEARGADGAPALEDDHEPAENPPESTC